MSSNEETTSDDDSEADTTDTSSESESESESESDSPPTPPPTDTTQEEKYHPPGETIKKSIAHLDSVFFRLQVLFPRPLPPRERSTQTSKKRLASVPSDMNDVDELSLPSSRHQSMFDLYNANNTIDNDINEIVQNDVTDDTKEDSSDLDSDLERNELQDTLEAPVARPDVAEPIIEAPKATSKASPSTNNSTVNATHNHSHHHHHSHRNLPPLMTTPKEEHRRQHRRRSKQGTSSSSEDNEYDNDEFELTSEEENERKKIQKRKRKKKKQQKHQHMHSTSSTRKPFLPVSSSMSSLESVRNSSTTKQHPPSNQKMLQHTFENGFDKGYKAATKQLNTQQQQQQQQPLHQSHNQPQRQQNNTTNAMDALMASNNYEGDQSTPPLQATPLSRSLSNSIPKHTTNSEELFVPSSTASLLSTLTRNVSDNVFRRAPTAPIPQDDPELIAELNALREIEQQYRKDKKLLKKAKSKKAYQFYQQQLMKKGWCIWKKTIRMQHITQRLKHRFQRKHLHAAFQTWHNNMKQNQTLSKIEEVRVQKV